MSTTQWHLASIQNAVFRLWGARCRRVRAGSGHARPWPSAQPGWSPRRSVTAPVRRTCAFRHPPSRTWRRPRLRHAFIVWFPSRLLLSPQLDWWRHGHLREDNYYVILGMFTFRTSFSRCCRVVCRETVDFAPTVWLLEQISKTLSFRL